MFLKLVKHELHESFRLLLPMFGGLLLMGGLARGSIWVMEQTENPVFNVFGVMLIGLFFLSCIAAVVAAMILMMVRFARSVHGDEGYLTHTLPVGTHAILLSRVLVSLLGLLCAYATVYLSFRICVSEVHIMQDVREFFSLVFRESGLFGSGHPLLRLGVLLLVSSLSSILQIFAAISIGHSFNTGKTGKSVLFYFVLSFASSLITNLITAILTATKLLQGERDFSQITNLSTALSLSISVILIGVYYFITWIMTRKRLNLA